MLIVKIQVMFKTFVNKQKNFNKSIEYSIYDHLFELNNK
jgi:hypothetical protein